MIDEAAGADATVLATACPVTKKTLTDANRTNMEIRDIVELLAESL